MKGKVLREPQMRILFSEFLRDRAAISVVVEVDTRLMEESSAVLDHHALKAGDAIHLASALRLKPSAANMEPVVLVTSDRELSDAGGAEGFEVLNPEDDDASQRLRDMSGGA